MKVIAEFSCRLEVEYEHATQCDLVPVDQQIEQLKELFKYELGCKYVEITNYKLKTIPGD